MSKILNNIRELIANSIQVEVKNPIMRNGSMKYPILVTDISNSFTKGWYIQYNPILQDNGTRLYDGAETFSELNIANFSELQKLIITADYYFLQGQGVEQLSSGQKIAKYEINNQVRLSVTQKQNSVSVVVTVIDENSPFYMMSIPFSVTNNGQPYIVGTQDFWDRNTDMLKTYNAIFAPRKRRFYRVFQEKNGPAMLRAKIAVENNQYKINPDGTFEVDVNASVPEYIQVVTNEYKAMAYIYERLIMDIAFERALQQGLPELTMNHFNLDNFVPAFGIENTVQSNVNTPITQTFAPQPVQEPVQETAKKQENKIVTVGATPTIGNGVQINPSDLPWG